MNIKNNYHIYALITIIMWALSHIWIRIALEHFSVFPLGFLRYLSASISLIIVLFFYKMPLPKKKDLPWFILSGATGFFLYMIFYNMGAKTTTVATSGVILSSAPVFTVLFSVILLKERISLRQWLAITIEFIGILLITAHGAIFSVNIGILWLLAAALSLSIYNLTQRKLTKNYSALQATTFSIFAGTVLLSVSAKQSFIELKTASTNHISSILLLGIFASSIAYISWSKAFEKATHTAQVSNYMFFMPLMTGLLGFLFFGEIPTYSTWLGGALIIFGSYLFNYFGRMNSTSKQALFR
ncbi:MAG: EamA family transporter [Peptostreptococcaceae bacterium]|nr:EamA family transporter [Peptostreptococcaceae bacterium]